MTTKICITHYSQTLDAHKLVEIRTDKLHDVLACRTYEDVDW